MQASPVGDRTASDGAQAIRRATDLLTTIAGRPQLGWRLTDLCEASRLSKSTVHRILGSLVELRLLKQRATDKRYFPGPLLYDLALALPAHFAFQAACRANISTLAERLRTSVFLTLRSDDCYVCIDKAGQPPLGLFTRMGTRRPLISSGMGNAILVALDPESRAQALSSCISKTALAQDPKLPAYLRMYRRSRRCGYGINMGDLDNGLSSVAVPIYNSHGMPFASLATLDSSTAFDHPRIKRLLADLCAESEAISLANEKLIDEISLG